MYWRKFLWKENKRKKSKNKFMWEPHSAQTPGSSGSTLVAERKEVKVPLTLVSPWRRRLVTYCQPGIRLTAKLSPAIPTRLPCGCGKMPALPGTTFLPSRVHCLASQGSASTHLCYVEREISFPRLTGLSRSLWVTCVHQTSNCRSQNPKPFSSWNLSQESVCSLFCTGVGNWVCSERKEVRV